MELWNKAHLSLKGRILVAKTLLLSLVWYRSAICMPSTKQIQTLNWLINNFLWENKSYHLVALDELQKPKLLGGLDAPNTKARLETQAIKLFYKISSSQSPIWASLLHEEIVTEGKERNCNLLDLKRLPKSISPSLRSWIPSWQKAITLFPNASYNSKEIYKISSQRFEQIQMGRKPNLLGKME